jgi:Holliday junction resolvasome RuvABC endonuclease subunit
MSARYKVAGFDIGAKRCGWAYVNENGDEFKLMSSGVTGIERRDDEQFGDYWSRLIRFWVKECDWLIGKSGADLDKVIVERVPFSGVSTAAAAQRVLALSVGIIIESHCYRYGYKFEYIGATTVKKRLTGSGQATKVRIVNTVIDIFPELKSREKELKKIPDESDAIAVALVGLGYDISNRTK